MTVVKQIERFHVSDMEPGCDVRVYIEHWLRLINHVGRPPKDPRGDDEIKQTVTWLSVSKPDRLSLL